MVKKCIITRFVAIGNAMQVPTISVHEYLELLRDCNVRATNRTYSLVNRDVRKGLVYFRDDDEIRLFRRLLEASETGGSPPDIQSENARNERMALENAAALNLDKIAGLSEVNIDGYQHGQCPICAFEDATTSHTHQTTATNFWFNTADGGFGCFAGHTSPMIIAHMEGNE